MGPMGDIQEARQAEDVSPQSLACQSADWVDVCLRQVRRLRGALHSHAGEVYSLENRKFQLKMSLEERRMEVDVHRRAPCSQVRCSNAHAQASCITSSLQTHDAQHSWGCALHQLRACRDMLMCLLLGSAMLASCNVSKCLSSNFAFTGQCCVTVL